MKKGIDELAHELDCVSTTLSALGYSFEGMGEFPDLSKTSAQNIVFLCACHIDRVTEDMNHLDD